MMRRATGLVPAALRASSAIFPRAALTSTYITGTPSTPAVNFPAASLSTDAGKPKLGSVREILKTKGEKFYSTSEDAMVFEAVKEMVSHNIGSLVIVDEDKRPIGIITERDYLEKVIVRGRSSKNTKVSEIMSTKEFTFVAPDSTLLEAMELMSKRKIRHVPVVEKRKMLGMISIGDVVKELVELHRKDAENMREFISGGY